MLGRPFFPVTRAVYFGGDQVWYAAGAAGSPTSAPAVLARSGKRTVAVGQEALKLRDADAPGVTLLPVAAYGGLIDGSTATEFLRWIIAPEGRVDLIPPKVVVACAAQARYALTRAFEGAKIRKVITIPPAMAAALGLGLALQEPAPKFIFLLERDWCSFMAIGGNKSLGAFEVPGGLDQLLEDIAIRALAQDATVSDLDSLRAGFSVNGVSEAELAATNAAMTGRAARTNPLARSFEAFALRLQRRYRLTLQKIAPALLAEASTEPIHLVGPYATTPGIAQLVSLAFERRVVVSEHADSAVIRGVQKVIADLGKLLKKAK